LELELPGGFRIGDTVISKFAFEDEDGSVADGERGEVVGRANGTSDPKLFVLCKFPNFTGNLNVLIGDLELEALGGFHIGDPVTKKGAFKDANGSVADGDRGEVVGRSTSDPGVKVYCKFPKYTNFHAPVSELELWVPRQEKMRAMRWKRFIPRWKSGIGGDESTTRLLQESSSSS